MRERNFIYLKKSRFFFIIEYFSYSQEFQRRHKNKYQKTRNEKFLNKMKKYFYKNSKKYIKKIS